MQKINSTWPIIVLFLSSISWGLSWLPIQYFGSQGLQGVSMSVMAYGSAAIILLPILLSQRQIWRDEFPSLLSIMLVGGYANLSFVVALIDGNVIRVMVLFYLLPAWGTLGGKFLLKEHVDVVRWIAVAVSLVGAFLTLGGVAALEGEISVSDILAVTSGMAFAGNNLMFRAKPHLPMPSKVLAMFMGSSLLSVLVFFVQANPWPSPPPTLFFEVSAFGVVWLILATFASQWGVTHLEASRSSIIIIMELVASVVSAALLGKANLKTLEIVGGILIFTAAVVEALRETGHEHKKN